ncbi:multicopper oxidase family protein [Bradyrhizobium sp. HKCCYLS1011]|uniref:multicopper oxidase family protein n=1 Tax=Bradyrhizobium sp. HKCCYLS1011 TaxID=3420733 RepID=UPI003EBE4DDA
MTPGQKLSRRIILAGFGAGLLRVPALRLARAAEAPPLELRARAESLPLLAGQPATSAWGLVGPQAALRTRQGGTLSLALVNDLPVPTTLAFRGPGSAATVEPLLAQPGLAPAATARFDIGASSAGTGTVDLRLLADGAAPARVLPVIIDEAQPVTVDRDEIFLIEDWRLTPDGSALAPGRDPQQAQVALTVNGARLPEIRARGQERIRLRFINGCQRAVIAVKIADVDVRVMAIDSQPAEPFLARNGAVVMPPGGRADVLIDMPAAAKAPLPILLHDGTAAQPIGQIVLSDQPPVRAAPLPPAAPLPSNGLPEQLDLKTAVRIELALDGPEWLAPPRFTAASRPAFQAKAGRTVVLALTNRSPTGATFHLHGYPFRLLDRLDDGWKPYWLDTLALQSGQTQRIAFAAETAGRFLIESMGTDWAAPRLVRWYEIR